MFPLAVYQAQTPTHGHNYIHCSPKPELEECFEVHSPWGVHSCPKTSLSLEPHNCYVLGCVYQLLFLKCMLPLKPCRVRYYSDRSTVENYIMVATSFRTRVRVRVRVRVGLGLGLGLLS